MSVPKHLDLLKFEELQSMLVSARRYFEPLMLTQSKDRNSVAIMGGRMQSVNEGSRSIRDKSRILCQIGQMLIESKLKLTRKKSRLYGSQRFCMTSMMGIRGPRCAHQSNNRGYDWREGGHYVNSPKVRMVLKETI